MPPYDEFPAEKIHHADGKSRRNDGEYQALHAHGQHFLCKIVDTAQIYSHDENNQRDDDDLYFSVQYGNIFLGGIF